VVSGTTRTPPGQCSTGQQQVGVGHQQQVHKQERCRQGQGQWYQQHSQLKSPVQPLMDEVRASVATLSRPPYAATIGLLLFSWAGTSFAYYGLVQLVGELHMDAGHGASGGAACVHGSLQVGAPCRGAPSTPGCQHHVMPARSSQPSSHRHAWIPVA
jgi:hypothetical protein